MMILAPLGAMLVQMAISRTREYAADNLGARIVGQPTYLASALVKIANAAHEIPNIEAERNPATAHMFIINPLSVRDSTTCSRPIHRPRTGSPSCSGSPPRWGRRGAAGARGTAPAQRSLDCPWQWRGAARAVGLKRTVMRGSTAHLSILAKSLVQGTDCRVVEREGALRALSGNDEE